MMKNIVILLTLLLAFGEHKGTYGTNDISKYIHRFTIDAFDEFNLICYMSMYANINGAITLMNENRSEPPTHVFKSIRDVNLRLYRVHSWKKYLQDPNMIWINFLTVENWTSHYDDLVTQQYMQSDLEYTFPKNNSQPAKFRHLYFNTPRGKNFNEYFNSSNESTVSAVIYSTYQFCDQTLSNLSAPTQYFEQILRQQFSENVRKSFLRVISIYGCLVLLMNGGRLDNYIYQGYEERNAKNLVYVIFDTVHDIYKGIINVLCRISKINFQFIELQRNFGIESVDFELMKMMYTVYKNVITMSEELYNTMTIKGIYVYLKQKGIAEKKPIESVYSYEQFVDNFEEGWKHKFMSNNEDNFIPPSLQENGRLIKYGRVTPSLIGYYAIYKESWQNLDVNTFISNTDERIIFLMELNAWIMVLTPTLVDLKTTLAENLEYRRKALSISKPNFEGNRKFIKHYNKYFINSPENIIK